MVSHAHWKLARDRKVVQGFSEDPEVTQRRKDIALAWHFGQVLHDRRVKLGLSQTEVGRRAKMTQPQLSKMELGGTMPTLPLLGRLARALEAELTLRFVGDHTVIEFLPLEPLDDEDAPPERKHAEGAGTHGEAVRHEETEAHSTAV